MRLSTIPIAVLIWLGFTDAVSPVTGTVLLLACIVAWIILVLIEDAADGRRERLAAAEPKPDAVPAPSAPELAA